jgi:hypothetical protein
MASVIISRLFGLAKCNLVKQFTENAELPELPWERIITAAYQLRAAGGRSAEACCFIMPDNSIMVPEQKRSNSTFTAVMPAETSPKNCIVLHTHPCGAFHSGTDDEHLLVFKASVVVANDGAIRVYVPIELPCQNKALVEVEVPKEFDIPEPTPVTQFGFSGHVVKPCYPRSMGGAMDGLGGYNDEDGYDDTFSLPMRGREPSNGSVVLSPTTATPQTGQLVLGDGEPQGFDDTPLLTEAGAVMLQNANENAFVMLCDVIGLRALLHALYHQFPFDDPSFRKFCAEVMEHYLYYNNTVELVRAGKEKSATIIGFKLPGGLAEYTAEELDSLRTLGKDNFVRLDTYIFPHKVQPMNFGKGGK